MIYTVTFNPSLDYTVTVENFDLGRTNRTSSEEVFPGGKGINISIALHNMEIPNRALGFVAGYVGEEIEKRVTDLGLDHEFIRLQDGCSRINFKLKNYEGTEINGRGPRVDQNSAFALMGYLNSMDDGDYLVLAGSIPDGLPDTIYQTIMRQLRGRGIHFVVNATKNLLLNALEFEPFLIKPNLSELNEIFGRELTEIDEILPYAQILQAQGARNVLVSMGGRGAVLLDADHKVHVLPAPRGKVINAVGSGDAMVAGFLAGWEEKHDYSEAFRLAIAAGSATAYTAHIASREAIQAAYTQLQKADDTWQG